jgi:hypothetical protein
MLQSIRAPSLRHYILLTIFRSHAASTEIPASDDKASDHPGGRADLTGWWLRRCQAASTL